MWKTTIGLIRYYHGKLRSGGELTIAVERNGEHILVDRLRVSKLGAPLGVDGHTRDGWLSASEVEWLD